jgi:hypothetical protein
MNFWLRNLIFGVILAGLAAALLLNQDLLFSISQDLMPEEDITTTESSATPNAKKPKIKKYEEKNKNAAADGLSRFYANLHGDDESDGPKIRNNIVYLPSPTGDLVKILEARRMVTRPLRKNWKGSGSNHPFRLGETLFQKLSEYAENEGLEVLWWLDRDFVVKDPFRINKEIVATAYQVGKAVAGHFEEGISVYFCYQQRTLVLVEDEEQPYLDKECIILPAKKRRR